MFRIGRSIETEHRLGVSEAGGRDRMIANGAGVSFWVGELGNDEVYLSLLI
jgi:hypothetical protein